MKTFNWENYPRRILGGKDRWLPFPGDYPTRWAIDMKWGPSRRIGYTRHWRYLGKPNSTVAALVLRVLMNVRHSEVDAREFIKNGSIAVAHTVGARSSLTLQDWDQNKYRFVDPWGGMQNVQMITQWADGRMRPLPIIYNGRKWVIYSPVSRGTQPDLVVHKQWLDSVNIRGLRK